MNTVAEYSCRLKCFTQSVKVTYFLLHNQKYYFPRNDTGNLPQVKEKIVKLLSTTLYFATLCIFNRLPNYKKVSHSFLKYR